MSSTPVFCGCHQGTPEGGQLVYTYGSHRSVTNKRRLTCSVINQGEGSFAQIWENRAKILPENSNLGLERGLGQSSANLYSARKETGADSKAAHGHRMGVLVPVPDILRCPLKLPAITPGEGSSPFLHASLPTPTLSGTDQWGTGHDKAAGSSMEGG